MNYAVLIVDPQLDFMPGGSLPVPDGDSIIPVVNEWIADAEEDGAPVFISYDNHLEETKTHDGWPAHCLAGTRGWFIHPDIKMDGAIFISKGESFGAYSAFEGKSALDKTLDEHLKEENIDTLYVMGLALDYCVRETVEDALDLGYKVVVVSSGTRAVDMEPHDGLRAKYAMIRAGAEFII